MWQLRFDFNSSTLELSQLLISRRRLNLENLLVASKRWVNKLEICLVMAKAIKTTLYIKVLVLFSWTETAGFSRLMKLDKILKYDEPFPNFILDLLDGRLPPILSRDIINWNRPIKSALKEHNTVTYYI